MMLETLDTGILEVADDKSGDRLALLGQNSFITSKKMSLMTNLISIFRNQNVRFNMTDKLIENCFNLFKSCTWGFLESLMTNLNSKCQNSQWRIQYGERI